MTNKLLGLLGICEKAGRLFSGELPCEKSVKAGKTKLCLLASDASENTVKQFQDMCSFRNVPIRSLPLTKAELGRAIGKAERAVAVTEDAGFGKNLIRIIEGGM